MKIKCVCCGKFRKEVDLVELYGEYDESWLECKYCCSQVDYERYFKDE